MPLPIINALQLKITGCIFQRDVCCHGTECPPIVSRVCHKFRLYCILLFGCTLIPPIIGKWHRERNFCSVGNFMVKYRPVFCVSGLIHRAVCSHWSHICVYVSSRDLYVCSIISLNNYSCPSFIAFIATAYGK